MHGYRRVVLLLGAPGAGKGTQARFLGEILGVPHVASGDLLREHRRRGTELGRAAQAFMDRGDLVPDELVVEGSVHGPVREAIRRLGHRIRESRGGIGVEQGVGRAADGGWIAVADPRSEGGAFVTGAAVR